MLALVTDLIPEMSVLSNVLPTPAHSSTVAQSLNTNQAKDLQQQTHTVLENSINSHYAIICGRYLRL